MEPVDIEKFLSPVDETALFPLLENYENLASEKNLESVTFHNAFNYWLKLPEDKFRETQRGSNIVAITISIINNMTVEDNPSINKPLVNRIYGLPLALNSVFYGIVRSGEMLMATEDIELSRRIFNNLNDILTGTVLDYYWATKCQWPEEEEYLEILTQSGKILENNFIVMQKYSENKEDYSEIIKTLVIFNEIRNDYRSLLCDHQNWPEYDYVPKRKIGFPAVHAINSCPEMKEELISLLPKIAEQDASARRRFVELLDKCGSIQYTKEKLEQLRNELVQKIHESGGNHLLVQSLDLQ